MFRQLSLLTMMMPAMTFALDSEYFSGDATAYTLGQVSAGNCNFMYDPGVGHNYAALNNEQWDSTLNCGRCAQVSCDDSRCSNKNSIIVYIVDRCPECAKGSLDLSPTVFKQLTGSDPSRYTIKWKFVPCPVSGNINYCTKSGSSSSWLAVQPTNHATGVASMKIANQEVTMVDSCYFFLLNGGTNVDISAVDIEITSVAGETITETLSLTSDSCTVGTTNFKESTTQTSTIQMPPTIQPTPIPAPAPTVPTTAAPTVPTTAAPTMPTTAAPTVPTDTAPTVPTAAAPTVPTDTAPTVNTAAAPTVNTATSTTSSYTFTKGGSSQYQSQTQEQQEQQEQTEQQEQPEQQEQSEVTNFASLNANSNSDSGLKYKSGSVIAANESGSKVRIRQTSEIGVKEMSTAQQEERLESSEQPAASDIEHVNTKAKSKLSGTSTVVVGFIVLAVVCGIAFATVVSVVKKKKLDDKRMDRDMAMMRSFDTFSSPVRFDATIAKI
ncbi:hypothetical protein KXD40_009243 [Peronospora effusa]|nr:hypothetical protein KXD40_009243 [Peronospora effusa]